VTHLLSLSGGDFIPNESRSFRPGARPAVRAGVAEVVGPKAERPEPRAADPVLQIRCPRLPATQGVGLHGGPVAEPSPSRAALLDPSQPSAALGL